MAWEKILEEIDKVRQIVGEWQESGEAHGIEKEVALDKLRLIYDAVKFTTTTMVATSEPRQEVRPGPSEEKKVDIAPAGDVEKRDETGRAEIYDAPLKSRHDRKKLMSLYGDCAHTAAISGENHKNTAPECQPEVTDGEPSFADDLPAEEIVDMHAHAGIESEMGEDILTAMGLAEEPVVEMTACSGTAGDAPAADDNSEQALESGLKAGTPIAAQDAALDETGGNTPKKVFGDTVRPGQTLADVYARNHRHEDVAERLKNGSVHSIRGAIGINDRFLIMRDLFNGDGEACDRTIRTLDGFSDLDDAMLFIHDNFSWNPESDGAKLLIDLLTRKLS